jgi:hypothetical protein
LVWASASAYTSSTTCGAISSAFAVRCIATVDPHYEEI